MSCTKHRHQTRVDALIALADIQRKDSPRRPKTENRAYRCPNCKGWHLTSKTRSSEATQ